MRIRPAGHGEHLAGEVLVAFGLILFPRHVGVEVELGLGGHGVCSLCRPSIAGRYRGLKLRHPQATRPSQAIALFPVAGSSPSSC